MFKQKIRRGKPISGLDMPNACAACIVPENLPSAEDVKKVERRLLSEEKNVLD